MTAPIVVVNGVLCHELSAHDRAIQYGDGVFRTLAYRNSLIDWDLHYAKLSADAQRLLIDAPNQAQWASDIAVGLQAWQASQAAVKLVLSRGVSARGYLPDDSAMPTRLVYIGDYPSYPEVWRQEGVSVFDCQTRCAEQPLLAGVKHLNRLENILARLEWKNQAGYQEGLVCSTQGYVVSGVMSNVFLRKGAQVFTPNLSMAGVAGVTRQKIICYLDALGVDVQKVVVWPAQLLDADEVWLCNSLMGVVPVKKYRQQNWSCFTMATELNRIFKDF